MPEGGSSSWLWGTGLQARQGAGDDGIARGPGLACAAVTLTQGGQDRTQTASPSYSRC
jgi:hypothetical protein